MKSSFTYHSSASASSCPVCGQRKHCRSTDSGLTFCRETSPHNPPDGWHFVRESKIGFSIFARDDGEWTTQQREKAAKAETSRRERKRQRQIADGAPVPVGADDPKTWSERAFDQVNRDRRPLTDRQLDRLNEELGITLTRNVLDMMNVEFIANDGSNYPAWVMPMSSVDDATGRRGQSAVGFSLRYRREDSRREKKGRSKETRGNGSGLFLPFAWSTNDTSDLNATVYVPEGASDTLTLIAMGLNAVGRPNDRAGVDNLIALFRRLPASRRIAIVAENDQNADGRWPGREGAEIIARRLAEALDRVVYVVLPPVGVKDVREFARRSGGVLWAAIGAEWVDHSEASAVAFHPDRGQVTEITVAGASPVPPSRLDGYRAADSLPESMAAALNGTATTATTENTPKRCERRRGVLLRNDALRTSRLCWFDCQRLNCPHCAPRKKQQYIATVSEHLTIYGDKTSPTVVSFWCDYEDWTVIAARLRGAHANYFRLDTSDGRYLVIATDKPASTKITAFDEIATDDAIRKLSSAIEQIPEVYEKMLTTSREWKLVGTTRSSKWKGWRRVTAIAASQRAIFEVLDHHRVEWVPITQTSVYFGWTAWQFTDESARDAGGWQRVYDDLTLGEILPDFDVSASFGGGGGGGGWREDAGESATGPPKSIAFF